MIINLTATTSQRLQVRAQARGVLPERYIEEVLERDLAAEAPVIATDAIAEKRAKLARMAERAREIWGDGEHPPIPDGAFSSESLYEESE